MGFFNSSVKISLWYIVFPAWDFSNNGSTLQQIASLIIRLLGCVYSSRFCEDQLWVTQLFFCDLQLNRCIKYFFYVRTLCVQRIPARAHTYYQQDYYIKRSYTTQNPSVCTKSTLMECIPRLCSSMREWIIYHWKFSIIHFPDITDVFVPLSRSVYTNFKTVYSIFKLCSSTLRGWFLSTSFDLNL